ncbi:MAG: hypothetical protein QM778_04515 [Myxococcales bacterium]
MGVILFILASAVVGIRLLLLHRSLRQPPELFLGLGYLWAGTIGFGALLVGMLNTPKGQAVPEAYGAFSVLAGDIGTLFFYLFVWYVFRRDNWLAKGGISLALVIMVTSLVRDTWLAGVTFGAPPGSLTTLAAAGIRGAVFAWMACEAFGGYLAFRKRARIGLGNPMVANRLLLWGLSAVPSLGVSVVAIGLYVTAADRAEVAARQNAAGGVYGVLAALAATTLWLAFSLLGPTKHGSSEAPTRSPAMADSDAFVVVAQVLERATNLNELQSRGLVRRLLKEAGLSSDEVSSLQLAAVGRNLLAPALQKQGVSDVEGVRGQWMDACARLDGMARQAPRTNVSNTVEEVFARMGLRR